MTFIKYLTLGLLLILLDPPVEGKGPLRGGNREVLKFIMNYQTYSPVKIEKVILKTLPEKLSHRTDSLLSTIKSGTLMPDTIFMKCTWDIPNHTQLTIIFSDHKLQSGSFYFDPSQKYWDVTVSDSALLVAPHPQIAFSDKNSSPGIVALIRIFLEVLLAWLIIRVLNWSLRFVMMTLAANIAAFPLYLFHFQSVYTTEGLVILTEIAVMMLIGLRKAGWWRIILMALLINAISFGLEQLMMLIASVL